MDNPASEDILISYFEQKEKALKAWKKVLQIGAHDSLIKNKCPFMVPGTKVAEMGRSTHPWMEGAKAA